MKKLLVLILFAAMATVAVSCSDDDDNASARGTEKNPVVLKYANGTFALCDTEDNIGKFTLLLSSVEMFECDDEPTGSLRTRAQTAQIEGVLMTFHSEIPETRTSYPKSGTYRISQSEKAMTCCPGFWADENREPLLSGTAYIFPGNTQASMVEMVTDGTFSLSTTGDEHYVVTTDFTTDTGRKLYFKYEGQISFEPEATDPA